MRIRLWLLLFVLWVSPALRALDDNVSIYNYTNTRVAVLLNCQWYCILEPKEYRGLTVPWDQFQTLDFYRYPSGSINTSYRVLVSLHQFRPVELIYLTENELPP